MSRITKTPGIMGGIACIAGTRIPVRSIYCCQHSRSKMLDVDILKAFPTLTQADLDAARDYAEKNKEEIKRDVKNNK